MRRASSIVVVVAGLMSVASVADAKDSLGSNEVLNKGASLTSNNGVYSLACQEDGNLVLYLKGGARALWASNTNGRAITGCIMQDDGNLVLYAHSGRPVWATGTHGHPGASLVVQDDGNVVIYSLEGKALWATGTNH
jgi:hypothetical protein